MDFDAEKDYYRTLHLDRHAAQADVKKAFFTLAKKYHPDTKKSLHDADVEEVFTEKYREVNEAHRVLADPETRRAYDRARDERELGTAAPSRPAPRPDAPEPPPFQPPPVIQSDRGSVFVRKDGARDYIGEDGARYDVTADGRIRRLASPGLFGSVQRYAITGTPGEIIIGWIGRILLRLGILIARAVAAVLVNYPLFLSMTVVHLSPVRRLRQERAFIGMSHYASFTALNLVVLLGVVLLGVAGQSVLAGAALALHLVAASLFVLDLRIPYLQLAASGGVGSAVRNTSSALRLRRGIAFALYLVQLGVTAWLSAMLVSVAS